MGFRAWLKSQPEGVRIAVIGVMGTVGGALIGVAGTTVSAIATVGVAVVPYLFGGIGVDDNKPPLPGPTVTVTVTPTNLPSPSPGDTPDRSTPAVPSDTATSQPNVTYLADLPEESVMATPDPISLRGILYAHALRYGSKSLEEGLHIQEEMRKDEYSYDLGGSQYHSFDATVGLLPGSNVDIDAIVKFSVAIDGATVASKTCKYYSACPIHADLPTGSHLVLTMELVKWNPDETRYGTNAMPVWGDPRLQ
ncbi:NPCBM/NEW2 domain-containing protein [Flindersiella endophytica]